MKPGILVLLETFRSNFEFFLTSPTARLKKNSKLDLKVSRKTKIPGFIFFVTGRNPDIGTYVILSHFKSFCEVLVLIIGLPN